MVPLRVMRNYDVEDWGVDGMGRCEAPEDMSEGICWDAYATEADGATGEATLIAMLDPSGTVGL